jgi:hypothetical protein
MHLTVSQVVSKQVVNPRQNPEMMGHFMQPFITVNMTLSKQVKSLATYAFLAAAVQIKHGQHA